MGRYRAGAEFEREVRRHLEAEGYVCVRAAGSKGGTKADLIAFKPGQALFVQVKRHGNAAPAERQALLETARLLPGVAVPIVADRDGPRGNAIRLWRLTGVEPDAREPFETDEVAA